jgi:hypothetical protein
MSTRIMLLVLVLAAGALNEELLSGLARSSRRPEADPPTVSLNLPPIATIATPSAGASGTLRGAGAIALVSPTSTRKERHWPMVWFQVSAWFNRDAHKLRGEVEVDVPGSDLKFVGRTIDAFTVWGSRSDLSGTGRLGRRGGTAGYSYLVTAIDGGSPGRQDRLRIKIWNRTGVLFDTDPGLGDGADPAHALDLGRIVVHP